MWKRIFAFALYPFLLVVILFALVVRQYLTTNSGIIPLETVESKFNLSTDPKYLVQISDIHYSACYNSENTLYKVFSIMKNKIKSDFVILSGDITDNYNKCNIPALSEPILAHWQGYEKSINDSKIDRSTIFEVLGNHDMWGIDAYTENQFFTKFIKTFNKSNFYSYSQVKNGLRVVAFQPQDFPTGHGPNFFMPIYRSWMINAFEKEITKYSTNGHKHDHTHSKTIQNTNDNLNFANLDKNRIVTAITFEDNANNNENNNDQKMNLKSDKNENFDTSNSYFEQTKDETNNNEKGYDKKKHAVINDKYGKLDTPISNSEHAQTHHRKIEGDKKFDTKSDNDEKIDTIVVSHFPRETCINFNSKSDSGKTFSDLLRENNVLAHITGHTHPLRTEVRHINNDYVEFTSTAFKKTLGFVILTIDNGMVNYELKDLDAKGDYAIVTSPAPTKYQMKVRKSGFIPIRILSFSDSKTKNFTVSGSVKGKLEFDRYVKEGVALYSMQTKFEKGKNFVKISGDYDYIVEFSVGEESGPFREPRIVNVQMWWTVFISFFIYLYLILILFSIWKPLVIKGYKAVLYGPLYVGSLVSRVRTQFKIILTVFFFWPFILPCLIYQTQGHISMLWLYGLVVHWKNNPDLFGFLVTIFYHVTIFIVFIDVSMLIVRQKTQMKKIFFDILIGICLLLIGYGMWYRWGSDIGYKYYWLFSFTYTFIPISFIIFSFFEWKFHSRRFKID